MEVKLTPEEARNVHACIVAAAKTPNMGASQMEMLLVLARKFADKPKPVDSPVKKS